MLIVEAARFGGPRVLTARRARVLTARRARDPAAARRGFGHAVDLPELGTALSIGVFFSVMIAGLASRLPGTLSSGLRQHGVAPAVAHQIATLPPVSSLFAAVLGVNPL